MSVLRRRRLPVFCKARRVPFGATEPCSCSYSEGELMCRNGEAGSVVITSRSGSPSTVGYTETEDGLIETSIGGWLWRV